MSQLVDEARRVAQTHLEVSRPARWQHVTAVAAAAERLAALSDAPSSETVVTAAWLHDIGHAPGVRDTGFHALDEARFLTRMRRFPAEVIALVAHHSGADSEAAEHGLHRHLARFRRPEPTAMALLSAADLCTGPSRYRAERGQWHVWLDARDKARDDAAQAALDRATPVEHPDVEHTFWEAVMANAPPGDTEEDMERHAIELVADQLGGRVMTARAGTGRLRQSA